MPSVDQVEKEKQNDQCILFSFLAMPDPLPEYMLPQNESVNTTVGGRVELTCGLDLNHINYNASMMAVEWRRCTKDSCSESLDNNTSEVRKFS